MMHKDSHITPKVLSPVELDNKSLTETGEFEGYASVFGVKDQGGDTVISGAFADSLAVAGPERVKMLWQHRQDKPIGKWLEMREDGHGLYVKGRLFLSVAQGRETYELMREGVMDGLSIGYRMIDDDWNREEGTRKLLKVDLKEVSCVTFPMLPEATVSLVKGDTLPTEREFERFLMREAGFSAQQAKAIIADGFKSLRSARDAGEGDEAGLLEALRGLRASLT